MEALDKPQIIVHLEKSVNYTAFDTKWVPSSAKFVVLGSHPKDTGALQVYEINKGELKLVLESEKRHSFKCGTFGAASLHQRQLATGDLGGRLNIWDLDRIESPIYSVKAHEQIVNTIDGCGGLGIGGGAPELVTGSRDGSVKVWDPRQKDVPVACMEPAEGEMRRDCWTVCFGNSFNDAERCVCAGYDNGDIKLFDLRTMTLRWEANIKNGVCCVEFDRKDILMNKLVATTLESKFTVYDLRTQHPTKGFSSLTEKVPKSSTLWCVRHLPQNRDIFMTSGGGTFHLWKYSYPSARVKEDEDKQNVGVMGTVSLVQNVTLSSQPICSFDWNADKEGLLTSCAFDQTIRVCIVSKLKTL